MTLQPKSFDEKGKSFIQTLDTVFPMIVTLVAVMSSIFFLALFLQAYESDRILTHKFIILTIIFISTITSLILSAFEIKDRVPSLEGSSDNEIREIAGANLLVLGISTITAIIFCLALTAFILKKIMVAGEFE